MFFTWTLVVSFAARLVIGEENCGDVIPLGRIVQTIGTVVENH